jgi:quercetin dioxygenase-like cupin family protein
MLLKMPAGFEAGMHSHTADYHGIVVEGTWVHTAEGDTNPPKELGPGGYVFQPGKQNHNDVCKGKTDCIVLVHQHGKGDFIPAKPVAKK